MAEARLLDQLFGSGGFSRSGGGWPSAVQIDHGSPNRLPAVFQQPVLKSLEQLAEGYRGPLSFGRGLQSPQTFDSHANAAALMQLGLTVYLQDITSRLPGATAFLRALERELGVAPGSARLSAFASPGDDGVSCHYDAEDVISIQLLGRKTFYVAPMTEIELPYGSQFGPDMVAVENLYEQVRNGFPDPADVTFQAHDMQPGSVLYLPRGTWHKTQASEPSLSLSLVIRPPVLAEALLGWLKPWLLGDARWRSPIYGEVDRGGLKTMLGELADRLNAGAESSITDWHSASSVAPADVSLGAELLRVPGSQLIWQDVPGGTGSVPHLHLQVTALDQDWRARITLDTEIPKALLPAIVWLKRRKTAFDLKTLAEQLPQRGDADLRQLLALLVKAHALRLLVPR